MSDADKEAAALGEAIRAKLTYVLAKNTDTATGNDWYQATALAVRDRIIDIWLARPAETTAQHKRRVYYLSIEFLIGRLLLDALTNLRLVEPARRALAAMDVDLDALRNVEPDAALGNGGLGRLAAGFMDSLSALGIPAFGYGIRYEHGLFDQRIRDGWQQEVPENWLARGNPWEIARQVRGIQSALAARSKHIGGGGAPRAPFGRRRKPSSRCRSTRRS